MVDPRLLSIDLSRQVRLLEEDLRGRVALPGIDAERLRAEYERAVRAGRIGVGWEAWRDDRLTQTAIAWVLATVFVRFTEDNNLLTEAPRLTGRTSGATIAAGAAELDQLLSAFDAIATTAGGKLLFDPRHNPLHQLHISDTAAGNLIEFWQRRTADGRLVHDFVDPTLDTRFLSDLYEGLSESARKSCALIRTPEFVVEYILKLTLDPAIEEFGHDKTTLFDPVCGSGSFVLGALHTLTAKWRQDASLPPEETIRRSLRAVHAVDINPAAAMITRFRLLIAALQACNIANLGGVPPNWTLNVAVGDALLGRMRDLPRLESDFRYAMDDLNEHESLFAQENYHVVVGNPPYLTIRDKHLHGEYRRRYDACGGAFPLTVPFIQRFFQLAFRGDRHGRGAGYVGLLTANSFMKREFGRKLIEQFFAERVTVTRVIDTSGAFIPGHGTPTVILVGRNAPPPATGEIRTVVGLHGEPAVPDAPETGRVWQSILRHTWTEVQDDEWTESLLVSRESFRSHPWNLAGEGTRDVVRAMSGQLTLEDRVARIGYSANSGSDDLFTATRQSLQRSRTENSRLRVQVISGADIRDWVTTPEREAFWPREGDQPLADIERYPGHHTRLWPYRTVLGKRPNYSTRSYFEDGRRWYDWHHVANDRHAHPWSITFSWVATHNHFAIVRGRVVALPSAPVIKLPGQATEQRHIELAGLLNSSATCFWLKQHSNSKGRPTPDQTGSGEPWTEIYEFTARQLGKLPLPADLPTRTAVELELLARELTTLSPAAILVMGEPSRERLATACVRWHEVRHKMIALQEELDWEIYRLYGLLPATGGPYSMPLAPPLQLGERAFEIQLARRVQAGEQKTTWFARHGSTPVTALRDHWPASYREVVNNRISAITNNPAISVLERPEYKRRWGADDWDGMQRAALREWLLDRCESADLWFEERHSLPRPVPRTVDQLASQLGSDPYVREVASLYDSDRSLIDILKNVTESEQTPYLAALRYRDSGMAKRAKWEHAWRLQQEEDARRSTNNDADADAIRDAIPVPPKYVAADFIKTGYWRQRGKYDVPNERFISYPGTEPSGSHGPLLGWAGWDYEMRAQVLRDLIMDRLDSSGRPNLGLLTPLLAGLREALPWLSSRAGHDAYIRNVTARLGLTYDDLASWRPPRSKRGRPRKES